MLNNDSRRRSLGDKEHASIRAYRLGKDCLMEETAEWQIAAIDGRYDDLGTYERFEDITSYSHPSRFCLISFLRRRNV